mmetsp:Transcript_14315/g.23159  ORF Transcript_14315/g.23159 Transcript_14315/m.23159 type:complete len:87 (+) Transcript_14315:810-1070(+)
MSHRPQENESTAFERGPSVGEATVREARRSTNIDRQAPWRPCDRGRHPPVVSFGCFYFQLLDLLFIFVLNCQKNPFRLIRCHTWCL